MRGIAASAFLSLVLVAGLAPAADLSSWQKVSRVQFSGYTRPETLTNFPALVVLSTNIPGFDYSQFLSGSNADLRFTDVTTTQELNYEVEKWDTSGDSFVWVQLPLLADTNTAIWAFWGKAGQTAPAYTTNGATWETNYIAVWHLAQTNAIDSTTNRNNATTVGSVTLVATGKVDGAIDLDATSDYLTVPDSSKFTLSGPYTVSAWIQTDAIASQEGIVGTYNGNGFIFALTAANALQFYASGVWFNSTNTVPDGVWKQVAYARDGGVGALYVDGVRVATNAAQPGADGGQLRIGAGGSSWSSQVFDGRLDEIRLASAARSSNWMWACWMNQASNASFSSASQDWPMIANVAASDLSGATVTLNAMLVTTGTAPTFVTAYWGTSDGGTTPANWEHTNEFVGAQAAGPLSTNVSGIVPGSIYYVRFCASNSFGTVWGAPAATFAAGEVTVVASDASAAESGADPGTFTVSRPDWSTNAALVVNYTVGGAAIPGIDYVMLPGSVTILIGASNAAITVMPLADGVPEPVEDVTVTLVPGAYLVGAASNASVSIADGTWYVATNGVDASAGTNWSSAFLTISNAVGRAGNGDLILVSNGTYGVATTIVLTNAVTLRSYPNDPTSTAISKVSSNIGILVISNSAAVVDGFTITNGGSVKLGAGVYMTGGRLQNCVIRNNTVSGNPNSGAGVWMSGGTVSNCVIRNNTAVTGPGHQWGTGVAMYGAGCVLQDSTIYSNSLNASYSHGGAGVYLGFGLVERCVIFGNQTSGTCTPGYGGGLHIDGGAGIYAGTSGQFGSGTGGVIRNCLIYGNQANTGTSGGGVLIRGGSLDNCTVVRNSAASYGGGGVNATNCGVRNSIIAFNTAATGAANITTVKGVTNSCSPDLTEGVGNLTVDPLFVNAGSGSGIGASIGDAHLLLYSLCLDAGLALPVTNDLEGVGRPLDGNSDGTSAWDMGAYEVNPTSGVFRCAFRSPTTAGMSPLSVAFTAWVAGTNTDITTYVWDFNNDGTPDASGADQKAVTNLYASAGAYTVVLTVSNAAGQAATLARTNYVNVTGGAIHVSPVGSQTPPYNSWETAATNLTVAVAAALDGGQVLVTNGVYAVTSQVAVSYGFTLSSVNGPEGTVIDVGGVSGQRCLFVNNANAVVDGFTLRNGNAASGSGLYMTYGGLVRNCLIMGNRTLNGGLGAGVWMDAGTLRNCVVRGNQVGTWTAGHGPATGDGGGVLLAGGAMEHCTVTRNRAGGNGGGVYKTGGTIVNSIIYDNRAGSSNDLNTSVGVTNSCGTGLATNGTGNLTVDPQFVDRGVGYGQYHFGGVFRLDLASPCLDAGTNLAAVTTDLAGQPRPFDGNSDGLAVADMGAYEVTTAPTSGALRCSFSTPNPGGQAPLSAVFTATVAGTNTNITVFVWDFTADGTPDAAGPDGRVVTNLYATAANWFSVALTVSNTAGETATLVRTNYLQIPVAVAYVSTNGAATVPFATWATAARDISSAVEETGTNSPLVLVAAGRYALAEQAYIAKDVTVRSVSGASNTFIDAGSVAGRRCFQLASSNAMIDGFTIRNGQAPNAGGGANGSGIHMMGGAVLNCLIVSNAVSYNPSAGGGVYMTGGVVSNCIILQNRAGFTSQPLHGWGGGVALYGGVVRDCQILSNAVNGSYGRGGGGVHLTAGTVQNCTIIGNLSAGSSLSGTAGGGGVFSGGGTQMSGNGGAVRNCLIMGNQNQDAGNGGGVNAPGSSSAIENCTVVRNSCLARGGIYRTGGTVKNTLVDLNSSPAPTNITLDASVTYSCAPELVSGDGNRAGDPLFRELGGGYGLSATGGNYRLRSASPCYNAGTNLSWVGTAIDLDGRPRVEAVTVDIGCYELPPVRGTVFTLR